MEKIVVLVNVRSAHNVGSIFRTADGAGVSLIHLVGYTPAPIDRFGRVQPEIEKTSLGASKMVRWEYFENGESSLQSLRRAGTSIVAVEQTSGAHDYRTFTCPSHVAFIFGNEREGVPQEICAQADASIMIPMEGKKESLNVSVAAGVILFNFN